MATEQARRRVPKGHSGCPPNAVGRGDLGAMGPPARSPRYELRFTTGTLLCAGSLATTLGSLSSEHRILTQELEAKLGIHDIRHWTMFIREGLGRLGVYGLVWVVCR